MKQTPLFPSRYVVTLVRSTKESLRKWFGMKPLFFKHWVRLSKYLLSEWVNWRCMIHTYKLLEDWLWRTNGSYFYPPTLSNYSCPSVNDCTITYQSSMRKICVDQCWKQITHNWWNIGWMVWKLLYSRRCVGLGSLSPEPCIIIEHRSTEGLICLCVGHCNSYFLSPPDTPYHRS